MPAYQTEFTIDFGEVGYWNSKQPFRIRLDANALAELIERATNAHRVYELMLIDRPGDVWDYVWVTPEDVPPRVTDRVEHAREKAKPRYGNEHPWPEGRLPFTVFDGLFYWAGDDTEPEDEAWLNHRSAPTLRAFANQLLAMANAAQISLDWNDPLLRHQVARVRSGSHTYAFLDRSKAIAQCRENPPNEPGHTAAFYKKLDELVRDPEIASVAYRANGDYRVLRTMATEQRRRANRTGHNAGHALHLSALVNRKVSNESWDSEIWFFDEGLAHGDLFIEGGELGGNIKALIEVHHRIPGRAILATEPQGDIAGFELETGNGWALYRRQTPDSRRVALDRIADRRPTGLGPVLAFEDSGATLYDYDKTVIVVGQMVPGAVRMALGTAVAEWQAHGGDPLLMVIGDASPFEAAGCREIHQVPEDLADTNSPEAAGLASAWAFSLLKHRRRWVDVAVMLDAPDWIDRTLADYVRHPEGLWKPWGVATPGLRHLTIELTLEGHLADVITSAHLRARSLRPQLL